MANEINLIEFYSKFVDEQVCRNYLEKIRWGDNINCPQCSVIGKSYKYSDGRLFKCSVCRKQFTVRVGTIFGESKLPLQKWFLAIYLATNLKKGISSMQLSKYLGVTQKTAWHMLNRIRYAIETTSFETPSDNKEGLNEAKIIERKLAKKNLNYDNKIFTSNYESFENWLTGINKLIIRRELI